MGGVPGSSSRVTICAEFHGLNTDFQGIRLDFQGFRLELWGVHLKYEVRVPGTPSGV